MRNLSRIIKIVVLSGVVFLGLTYCPTNHVASRKVTISGIKSVKAVGSKKIVVRVKKQKSIKGYQVRYSTKKNMKNATIRSIKTNRIVDKNLHPQTRYFVQVRSYKRIEGRNVYSKWSEKKKSLQRHWVALNTFTGGNR